MNNIQLVQTESEEENKSRVSFKDIWAKCVAKWYLFLISLFLCFGFSVLYILRTRPMYTSSATILIKEASTRRMATSDIESVLSFSGGSSMSSKVVNEVIAFRSPALMISVVDRLGLETEYSNPGLFRLNVIYGCQVPVEVKFLDIPEYVTGSFYIEPKDENSFAISEMEYQVKSEKYRVDKNVVGNFEDTLSTPMGKIVIVKNKYFTGEWGKKINVYRSNANAMANRFLSSFKAEPEDVKNHSDVINISISDASVQRANDILNMMISIYNESWVEDKNKMAISTTNFIEERLNSLEHELGSVDEDIAGYKRANLIPEVDNLSDAVIAQKRENQRLIMEIDNQLYLYRYLMSFVTSSNGENQLLPMGANLLNTGISSQIAEYNKLFLSRNNILANSSEKNPLVSDIDNSLSGMRSAIESSINNQVASLEQQLATLTYRENNATSQIAKGPEQVKYLTSIGRQQKVKESLYLYLLQKREENELSQAFTAYNTRIITPPMGKSRPSSPSKKRILLLAFLLGIVVPFSGIYLYVLTDTKIRTKKDLEKLSLPFLGEIPLYSEESKKINFFSVFKRKKQQPEQDVKLVVHTGSRNIINESFRVLRTNLEFMNRGIEHPVIIMTSFNPGSGKTFLTMNTAASFAIKGKKVLVIDGDFRRSSTSAYIDTPKTGISDYLTSAVDDIDSIIVKVKDYESLYVLPVGTVPPNPSELIGDRKFADLILSLKNRYDMVFIDCPPLDIVADTQIIEEVADRSIFVVRAGLMEKSLVPDIQKLYSEKKMKNISLILNGTEPSGGYYGHYGHYGSYGHYYGYIHS